MKNAANATSAPDEKEENGTPETSPAPAPAEPETKEEEKKEEGGEEEKQAA